MLVAQRDPKRPWEALSPQMWSMTDSERYKTQHLFHLRKKESGETLLKRAKIFS